MSAPASGRDPARLLAILERLLAITAPTLQDTLQEASDALAEALRAEKTDAFLYNRASDSLVALSTSRTPLGQRQHALGLHRQPLSQGGSAVWTFTTHHPSHQGHADQDPWELRGVVEDLGVRSQISTPFVVAGESRGVLQACSTQSDWFTLHDLHFLTAVAHWLGLVAQRSELAERASALSGSLLTVPQVQALIEHERQAIRDALDEDGPAAPWKARLVRWTMRQMETQAQETEQAMAVLQATFLQSQQQLVALLARVQATHEQVTRHEVQTARAAARVRHTLEQKLRQAETTIAHLDAQLKEARAAP